MLMTCIFPYPSSWAYS